MTSGGVNLCGSSGGQSKSINQEDWTEKESKWTVEGANKRHPWLVIDHEEFWSNDLKAKINQSPRLQELMSRNRSSNINPIVSLPPFTAVVRQFYCANCQEIPFPWAKHPSMILPGNPAPESVFLCNAGHALCRTCRESYTRCVLTETNCDYVFCDSKTQLEEKRNFGKLRGKLGGWKRLRRCFKGMSWEFNTFLRDMILATEFACRYFYDYCDFVGNGENLRDHEKACPCAPPEEEEQGTIGGINRKSTSVRRKENVREEWDAHDAGILNVTQKYMTQGADSVLEKILQENWHEIDRFDIPHLKY